ncbi:MAG: hypothetical protein M3O15_00870, partial [Acidobacteriota bacterium]|nr:hypothetical protein [Acidobacteriota bacterium]
MSITRADVRAFSRRAAAALPLVCLFLLVHGAPRAARADDRNLVKSGQRNPYLFVILDVSGSMHQSVNCAPADIAAGVCTQQCDQGDCLPRLSGDDPESKISVAKQSIYEIMQTTNNVSFGFATFDQASLHMSWKHWWYEVAPLANQPSGLIKLDSGIFYPADGQEEVFGQQAWNCT